MWCVTCNNHIGDCTCPDIDERLASVASSPYLHLTMCSNCGKHVTRCDCPGRPRA